MKRIKLISLLLCCMFIVSVFVGCGTKDEKGKDSSATDKVDKEKEPAKGSEKDKEKAQEEPLELKIRMHYHSEIDNYMAKNQIKYDDNKIANFHRENSGVNVTFEPALADGQQESQKKAMILASNDTPDLMEMNRNDYFKYAMQGVLTETEPYLEMMPDYVKLIGENIRDAIRYKGKMYSFPSELEEIDLHRDTGAIMVRKDVLDDLNIDKLETIEDFYQMWKTVKEQTDYIPLTSTGFAPIQAAFRVALDYKEVGDDELEYIWVQPEYKEYLSFMNRLYTEGLLDKEYITLDTTRLVEKFMGDQAFSTCTGWSFPVTRLRELGEKIDGAEVSFLPQPAGVDDTKGLLYFSWPAQRLWVVPAAAKNKEAAAKFINYMATEEAKMVQDYGIEGEDYTMGADGQPEYTTEQQMAATWRICYEMMNTADSFKIRLVAKDYDWAYDQLLEGQKNADITDNILGILPPDDEFLKLQQKLALDTIVDEETTNFITGDRPISDFDKFVEELKAAGLDEQTEALNKWYKENKQ